MKRFLVLTTDLPYFPGRNGHDFFNLRHLACDAHVGIVAPRYPSMPDAGVANLRKAIQASYIWPDSATPVFLHHGEPVRDSLRRVFRKFPRALLKHLLKRALGIDHAPPDALEKLAILANCAPLVLEALHANPGWDAIVLIQSSTVPWLDYLPSSLPKVIYFHDVRSDYLDRARPVPGASKPAASEIAAIHAQEANAIATCDAVGFVSELDHERALRRFGDFPHGMVAPIPVDTDYFTPPPKDWIKPDEPEILFTGHLSHPPNVDAVLYFLKNIWPLIRHDRPKARLKLAGMLPAPALVAAAEAAPGVSLHPNVPDIRPYFWNASAYIVPMRFGGGVRQKIFEAWAMHVPVVCTTMAAEGIGAMHGQELWMEDTPESFACRVLALLKKPDLAAPLIDNAAEFVAKHHAIPVAGEAFARLVRTSHACKRVQPPRILIDMRWMELGKAGGAEQAAHELVQAISRLDHSNDYRLLCPCSTYHEWAFPSGFRHKVHFTDRHARARERLCSSAVNGLCRALGRPPLLTPEMRTLAAYRRYDFDLVHSTISYTHPDLLHFPGVLTMHDLQHLHHPEFFSPEDWRERDHLYRNAVEHARHVICISEFTRQDLHRRYGTPLEKTSVVWNIPSSHAWERLPLLEHKRLVERMGLAVNRFALFPAHCWPHKNHARLIEAWALAKPELPPDFRLVLTGREFANDHPALELIRKHGLQDAVLHLGYRSPLEMKALFEAMEFLVFPSLFEGFGMPVAEALIVGRPVLCSSTTSLPEITGDAALTFDPTSPPEIAAAIVSASRDKTLHRHLSDAASRRRHLFSAKLSAIKTLAVYHHALS